ncbi:tRNA uracil 4-sulfurtransferase ThiI [Spiroplasma melliferum]|uniref:Probable tRNA sulfurtransferase n=2 Tax=Spiroplasma melliferum TaxID=2134 RepID=A0AAI9T379_SPIME|nr:tRNA uracil 4-sulfurtransferase ThiI [Spiroplasma melliferum]ELL44880.1 thiamine biosynthesis protein ThiI [Spiroplasma melliferum IPMB4A]KAI92646.1 thiamine biosynthesis protein ThiI [Spiroplasma melliferum KC3]QCO24256.1 thiamine biosynthesis protein ThiI [Spiroplasma melliferum]
MNFDVILIRYGELTTKGKNRNNFTRVLVNNIKTKLVAYENQYQLKKEFDRLFIELLDATVSIEIVNIVKNVFGSSSLSLAKKVSCDLSEIANCAINIVNYYQPATFKLEVRRNDKTFPLTSTEIKQQLAPKILQQTKVKVDVHQPVLQIDVEVRRTFTYVFVNKIKTIGGLPVGISGQGLVMLSGGIDSPVASFLTMKRGMNVEYLHFATPPHTTEEALQKVKTLVQKLNYYAGQNQQRLHVVNFSMLQHELMHIPDASYRIIIMRRMFYRIANLLAKELKCQAIITGESLGQVASQTIESINTINAVSTLPILRPVLCFDKNEIIDIAKQIDTYQTSILPFEDCCSLFVPKNPVTKPRIKQAEFQEKNLMWAEIIDVIIKKNIKTYVVGKDVIYEEEN